MSRSILLACALASFTLATACSDDAADMQRAANKAQSEADAKIAAVGKEATAEVVEAHNDANDRIGDATADADQKIRDAQADADKAIASVQADFSTLREEYRHTTTVKLTELDKKIAELEARAMAANGEKKAALEAKLTVIRTQRGAFMSDYATLDRESAATWDVTRARLDRGWSDLEARVAGA